VAFNERSPVNTLGLLLVVFGIVLIAQGK